MVHELHDGHKNFLFHLYLLPPNLYSCYYTHELSARTAHVIIMYIGCVLCGYCRYVDIWRSKVGYTSMCYFCIDTNATPTIHRMQRVLLHSPFLPRTAVVGQAHVPTQRTTYLLEGVLQLWYFG